MPGMNWDRVRREKPLINDYDYSRLMDERDRGVVFGHDPDEAWERLADRRERQGRPMPPPRPSDPAQRKGVQNRKPAASRRQPKEQKAQGKAKRDAAAAAKLGISVRELKARRREEAERNLALKREAERRGITVKQLRKLLGDGPVPSSPPKPKNVIVSRTGRREH